MLTVLGRVLNDHVEEQQDKIEIYHQLYVLSQERKENQFIERLQQLMSFLNDNSGMNIQTY